MTLAIPGVRRRVVITVVLALVLALSLLPVRPVAGPGDPPDTAVIVRAVPGAVGAVVDLVDQLGGTVDRRLGLIDAVRATVPAGAVSRLAQSPTVVAVTADRRLRPMSSHLGYDATGDFGSLSNITRTIGAQDAWEAGITGRGVEVALIDTGVTPVEGLRTSGKLVHGPDLSFDAQDPNFVNRDTNGHGTHMAGIIAGRDSDADSAVLRKPCATCLNKSLLSDTTKFVGVAPEATIVNVKVGATDGATDVSQVIAALEWVVTHGQDPGRNIKVVNLSFGTDSAQDAATDPLAYAVEVAWRKGIFVVASGGNDGTSEPELANPARNPFVVAVGSSHPNGTLDRADDYVPAWATRSSTKRNVDLVAPGASVLSLNVPASFVAENHPDGLVGSRFLRGSGTSQSAAVVSGAAALLFEKFPQAEPDQIKDLLLKTTYSLPMASGKVEQGKGLIDLTKALATKLAKDVSQKWDSATGSGSIDAARGSARVSDGTTELVGEHDVFGQSWDGTAWADKASRAANWSRGLWRGKRFTGDGWATSLQWATAESGDSLWNGSRWTGSRWTNMVWDGSRWTGDGWNGSRWTGSRWTGSRWSSAGWGF